jgi:hypothetical protein
MARTAKVSASSVGQESLEEMTVVILRLKGGGDTLKKGFDALTSAFSTLGPPPQIIRHANGALPKQLGGPKLPPPEERIDEHADEPNDLEIGAVSTPTHTPARTAAQPRKPKFLTDFNLDLGDVNWKDFATARAPKSDNEKYLLAALWITEKAKVPEFSVNHVFTCFRGMKWKEQVDFSQPIRYMKSKNSFFSHPSPKTWKLTQPGLHAARAVKVAKTV